MTRTLDVYFGNRKAGVLTQDEGGALSFAYAPTYLGEPQARAISYSMPLREQPFADRVARPFFSGLLPDEGARRRLATALGISADNPFGLLGIIGGDCAGALSLYPAGREPLSPSDADIEMLDETRLADLVARLRERPLLAGEPGIRLSLAGAQDKLAVCVTDDGIGIAKGGAPTTHILKPFIPALDGTVENELFCLRLAAQMQFAAPAAQMRRVGDVSFLLVQRYDRTKQGGIVSRLHQEDFCQALSVPPELKYEQEGGPGTARCLALIDHACGRPAADRLDFTRRLIFQYLVGNADAHAKNYALLYRDTAPDLAPLYDVLCTAVYPGIDQRLAMKIGERSVPDTIRLQDWSSLVHHGRAAQRMLVKELGEFATRIGTATDALLKEFSETGISHPVLRRVRKVIEARRAHLLKITEDA
ncbi:MAG: type II toxin-antitoxin system HipA family toxin [Burkholderiales bacterium]|nr:type II toxin-antitoxin system HipA family toxin [Burkholderiales bacterium]